MIAHSEVQVSKEGAREAGTIEVVGDFDQVFSDVVAKHNGSTVEMTPSLLLEETFVAHQDSTSRLTVFFRM